MEFFNIFKSAHKGFAYLVFLLVIVFIIALIVALTGNSGKITKFLKKTTLFTMVLFHIQFLVGISLLFIFSPGFKAALDSGTLMKNEYNRQTFVEHPFSMLVAAILMTIVNRKVKSSDKVTSGIIILSALALALFFFAFPFSKVFGG